MPRKVRHRVNPEDVAASSGLQAALRNELEDWLKSKLQCNLGLRRKRQSTCVRENLALVEESFSWTEDRIMFETVDKEGKRRSYEVAIDLNEFESILTEHTREYMANLEESGELEERHQGETSGILGTTEKALGVYGAIVNTLASIHYFS